MAKVRQSGVASAGDFSVLPAAKAVAAAAPDLAAAKPDRLFDQKGTGFLVSTNGHLVTNAHVVQGCVGDIQGNPSGEAPAKLRLVSSDETNDLALLQATGPFKDIAKIRDKAIQSGDSVVAIGYPFHGLLTSDFTVTTGIVSSLSGILNDTRFLQIRAAIPARQQRRAAIGLERRRGRRGRSQTECHQVREGHGQHSREHQFRHQDRGVAGFSRQQRGALSDLRRQGRVEDRRHRAQCEGVYVSHFVQGKGEGKETAKN